jgi:hypothetical protein
MFDFINDRNLIIVLFLCIAGAGSILYGLYVFFGLFGIVIPIGAIAGMLIVNSIRY